MVILSHTNQEWKLKDRIKAVQDRENVWLAISVGIVAMGSRGSFALEERECVC